MPKPAHALAVVRGCFGSSDNPIEEWQIGVGLTIDPLHSDFSEAQFDALAQGVMDAYVTNLNTLTPSYCRVLQGRYSLVGADGRVQQRTDGSYKQGIYDSIVTGAGSATPAYPTQVALVASLVTNRAGATGKGRIFLPMPALALDSALSLTEANAVSVANAVTDFLSDLNALGSGTVSVVSSKGYTSPVTGVKVGRIVDTMRSRRERRVEGYALDTVALTQ